jgi:nicotinamidase/pyrazinamidase
MAQRQLQESSMVTSPTVLYNEEEEEKVVRKTGGQDVEDDVISDDSGTKMAAVMKYLLLPVVILAVALCVAAGIRRRTSYDVGSVDDVTAALLVIDVQNCFTSGGSLAVGGGDEVIPVINHLRAYHASLFDVVVLTQDWHCPDHVSFASQHPGYSPFELVNLTYLDTGELCLSNVSGSSYAVNCTGSTAPTIELTQVLWPDHCVIDTADAQIRSSLVRDPSDIVVRKGYHCQIDSYSGFYDNGHIMATELHKTLQQRNVTTLYIVGLATDYCVYYTAKDGFNLGYVTYVILDATRGIAEDSVNAAIADMKQLGIFVINSTELNATVPTNGAATAFTSSFTSAFSVSSILALVVLLVANWLPPRQ